ncbi:MAG: peroxiredoxin family protein [Promethearchaeota archaeon]
MKDKFEMVGTKIPEFTLPNTRGDRVNIHSFCQKKNVLILLLRGLMCPFCRAHLARVAKKENLKRFEQLDTEIFPITVDRYENARRLEVRYVKEKFPIYFDKNRYVVKLLHQEVKILLLGRLPAVLIVDKQNVIQYAYYGNSMQDIPTMKEIFSALEKLGS